MWSTVATAVDGRDLSVLCDRLIEMRATDGPWAFAHLQTIVPGRRKMQGAGYYLQPLCLIW